MKKILRIVLFSLLALIFIGTFVFLFKKSRPKTVVYEWVSPTKGDIKKSSVATGSIVPRDEILIKPQISGIIERLDKKPGQTVKKGEIIARVKVIPDLAQLNAAEARKELAEVNERQARIEYQRMEKIKESNLISNEEFEKSSLAYRQAEMELQTAIDNLQIVKEGISRKNASISSTLIRSTVDGLILDIPVKVGNSVIMSNTFNDGTTIACVADMNDLIFKGYTDESEVGKLHKGMPVIISIGALQQVQLHAVLEYISPKGEEKNGANLFEIHAAISRPDSLEIRSGYSANAEIILQEVKDALLIPESVLNFSGDSIYVYLQNPEGKADEYTKRMVTTGLSNGNMIEVKSGLSLEDKVRGDKKQ